MPPFALLLLIMILCKKIAPVTDAGSITIYIWPIAYSFILLVPNDLKLITRAYDIRYYLSAGNR